LNGTVETKRKRGWGRGSGGVHIGTWGGAERPKKTPQVLFGTREKKLWGVVVSVGLRRTIGKSIKVERDTKSKSKRTQGFYF